MPRLPCICLTIEDSGTGIKQRHLASIFDPFFTTKSKGSGLGLYNARLAIEKHQGAISVTSKEGAGTSFQLWLPEADFSESARVEEEARRTRQARRSLLLVGQAGEVLDKTAELLRSHNYHIVVAASADNLATCFSPAITNSRASCCWPSRTTRPSIRCPANSVSRRKTSKWS
jgi:hypothetical protein